MIFTYLEENIRRQADIGSVTFSESCEVLCVGAGAAGAYAAMSAGREGADVIVIEKDENVGGMPICGKVPTFYYGDVGGTYEKAEEKAMELDRHFLGAYKHTESRHAALTELLFESGVRLFGGSVVIGVYMDGNRVVGARALIKGEITDVSCKILIDATSDGHVIRMCPVKTFLGRITDGKTAPFTNRIVHLDDEGRYGYYNDDDGYCDQYDPYEFSKKIFKAHAAKTEFIKKGQGRLLSVAPIAGVREGIRFEGEETLTYKDIIMGKAPEKVLFYARSDLDKHGRDLAIDEELYQNWWVICNLSTVTVSIPVPFGAVVPRGLCGIVSAGRCLSVDSYASSAVRMNRDMFRMGECVGVAAAMAVQNGCEFLELDMEQYLSKVKALDAFDGKMPDRFAFDAPNGKLYKAISFELSEEEILSKLDSDSPGEAIWACYISDGKIAEKLKARNDLHSAVALGIMEKKEALPRLREAVKNRSTAFFKGCRRSNQYKSVAAICIIGRLGDESDIDLISPIVFDPSEREDPIYKEKNDRLVYASDNCAYAYYQHFTHAVAALCKLCKKYGRSAELKSRLQALFTGRSREEIVNFISKNRPESSAAAEISDFMDNIIKKI